MRRLLSLFFALMLIGVTGLNSFAMTPVEIVYPLVTEEDALFCLAKENKIAEEIQYIDGSKIAIAVYEVTQPVSAKIKNGVLEQEYTKTVFAVLSSGGSYWADALHVYARHRTTINYLRSSYNGSAIRKITSVESTYENLNGSSVTNQDIEVITDGVAIGSNLAVYKSTRHTRGNINNWSEPVNHPYVRVENMPEYKQGFKTRIDYTISGRTSWFSYESFDYAAGGY